MGGRPERNVMIALAKIARQHRKMIPARVHVVVDFRTLLGPRLGYIVTTLPAKAGRVSGNACGDPLRSRLKAPSEPQYVLCGVNVPLGYVATRAVVQPIRELVLDLRKCTALATA
jgi:hypothetical protein